MRFLGKNGEREREKAQISFHPTGRPVAHQSVDVVDGVACVTHIGTKMTLVKASASDGPINLIAFPAIHSVYNETYHC